MIGHVVAPHGRRGTLEARHHPAAAPARRRRAIGRPPQAHLLVRQTPKGFWWISKTSGTARGGRPEGEGLVLDRSELDAPGEDEVYVDDLIGLAAVGEAGEVFGTVQETFETRPTKSW